ncbi:non-homologous end-joining DNA ligase [Nonomuraea sp. 10N515B]|uniref:non-homologous end-joining DNA ligase n=1 Tax=Nonomuraea sp. 10N515B TaxID=3457422 RepID=UPI003FCDE388
MTRNRKQVNDTYPEITDALAAQSCDDFVVDGEVVAFQAGVTSFSRLQKRLQLTDRDQIRASGVKVFYYLFDIVHIDGFNVTGLQLRDRKRLLRDGLTFDDPLRLTRHRNADGEAYLRQACRKGWEGVIAKRADAPYPTGRSGDWQKIKCENTQEFVIGGYTDPHGTRTGFGALLLGYHDASGHLLYAGKVGTGFDTETLHRLARELAGLQQPRPPFQDGELPHLGVHWVRPKLVSQISFTEWTRDGQLRHPRFQGLRRDKRAADVVREPPRS